MNNATTLSALESARLEPPTGDTIECPRCFNVFDANTDDTTNECPVCFELIETDADPDWENEAEMRAEMREERWAQ